MKLIRILTSLAGAGTVIGLTLAMVLPAQEPPPSAADASETAETTPPPATVDRDDGMRELGATVPPPPPAPPVAEMIEEIVEAINEEVAAQAQTDFESSDPDARSDRPGKRSDHGEMVQFFGDALLPAGQSASQVVAIRGNVVVDGESLGEAVAIAGNLTVNGATGREAVAVLGDVVINGTVEGQVVAVLGNVQLGPGAVVNGDIVCVGGVLDRAPGAQINGAVQQVPFFTPEVSAGIRAWVQKCLLMGRPLAFGEHLGWLWITMGIALGCYALLALILPSVVTRSAETMEKFPGMSLLSALLTLVITPIAMIVLSVTVVGPLVLGIVMLFVGIFGKVVFLAWLGRRITEPAGWKFPALAVLIGGVITLGIYLVPLLGFVFQKFSGVLGTGIVVYTIILALQENNAETGPTVPPATPASTPHSPPPSATSPSGAELAASVGSGSVISDAAAAPTAGPSGSVEPPSSAPPPPLPVSPPAQLSTLPRAGFWARFAATLIDVVALAIVAGILNVDDYFALIATVYFIVMWGLKGTTLGGVVLGLKIVRVDDKPVDWAVALVRSLGAFLSLCVMGLGFLWVAWDPRRQSWHDKIAGTTIVKMPKGVSLI
jgi:uncharacterized RDD family membrane protein YckC/cytoskeletal protein CcmA (bactofilin family)